MAATSTPLKIAVAQASPVFLDRDATIEKACGLIADAAAGGAGLVVFPEAFVPAYPDWVWVVPNNRKSVIDALYTEFLANSVSVPDDSTGRLCAAAKKAGIHVAIGISERNAEASDTSLYNSLLYIDATGHVLGTHRKLVPTGGERMMWAQGDGSTLAAYDTPFGKLGGLICWENLMPLARQAMYAWGTRIYVAPTWDSSENWLTSMRHIAREGGVFVVSCCTVLRMDQIPDRFEFKRLYTEREWVNVGNSCVIDPRGNFVAGPLKAKEELLFADADLDMIPAAKWLFDVAGHYARPDVFDLSVNRAPNRMIRDGRGDAHRDTDDGAE